jgi:hypothetical protein
MYMVVKGDITGNYKVISAEAIQQGIPKQLLSDGAFGFILQL